MEYAVAAGQVRLKGSKVVRVVGLEMPIETCKGWLVVGSDGAEETISGEELMQCPLLLSDASDIGPKTAEALRIVGLTAAVEKIRAMVKRGREGSPPIEPNETVADLLAYIEHLEAKLAG